MDSQQSIMSNDASSSLATLVSPPALKPAPPAFMWKRERWLHVEVTPPKRKGAPIAKIWNYGYEHRSEARYDTKDWRCGRCLKDNLVTFTTEMTTNCRRHLLTSHHIPLSKTGTTKAVEDAQDGEDGEEEDEEEEMKPVKSKLRSLIHVVNIEDFRFHLLRWIVERHVPFSVVEDQNFQLMLTSLNNSLSGYLVKSGDSIRNWLEDEFIQAQVVIRDEVIAKARSKIHISCDLWSAPNGYAMCGVAAHFVGHSGRVQHVLLALRRMRAAHGGREMAEVMIGVLKDYGIRRRLGVFVADNLETNDVAWKGVINELHPGRDPKASRSRCLGHIINLAAKAFLFGNNTEAFEWIVDLT